MSSFAMLILALGMNFGMAQNDKINLHRKSVMYRMGGKVFYGRAIKNITVQQQEVTANDSLAVMKVNKKDAFGNISEKNLASITDTVDRMEAHEEEMKVRKTDIFGSLDQKNLDPLKAPKLTIVETSEEAKMKVRAADAFGNVAYENLEPITQQKVILLDENEAVMRVTTTDAFGNFMFENLNPEGNYKIRLQLEENPGIATDNLIYVANNQGEVLQTFDVNDNKDFDFSTLAIDSVKIKLLEPEEVQMEK